MKNSKAHNWVCKLFNPVAIFAYIVTTSLIIALLPPKVSEWKEVIVIKRTELSVACRIASETEVTLVFSDGSTWSGYPSSLGPNETHLLHAQIGDVLHYRYNSHYFSGKQWANNH